jgi:predicted P-loop ATPase
MDNVGVLGATVILVESPITKAGGSEADPTSVKPADAKPSNGNQRITRARLLKCLADLDVELRHDNFCNQPQIRQGDSSWVTLSDSKQRRLWTDMETVLGFLPAQSVFNELVIDEAGRNTCDLLEVYLTSLKWDGVTRLESLLSVYFGAEETSLHAEFGARSLIGAVRRALNPGCKHDTMLVLEGPQGVLKSSAIKALCPDPAWFSDDLKLDADPREVVEQTGGKWILEAAELGGLRRADVDNLKAMLSRQSDKARPAYARQTEERQRRFIMFGTINPSATGYLKDNCCATIWIRTRVNQDKNP